MRLISDSYTQSEVSGLPGSGVPAWSAELGRRLELAARRLGKDKSVQVTGRSWKQLQRYFEGAEVPAGVVVVLAATAGASSEYLLNGFVVTAGDASLQRAVIDRQLAVLGESDTARREQLLAASGYWAKVAAVLTGRPHPLRSIDEYADPARAWDGSVSRDAVRAVVRDARPGSALDEALLLDVIEAIEVVLAELRRALPPEKKALLVKELYCLAMEGEGGIQKSVVQRLVRVAS